MAESDWFSGDVTVNGLKIHYRRIKQEEEERPVVVFSHSTTDSCQTWTQVALALEEYFDVIMYDRRGHGQSDAPETGYTFTDHASDLAGLIQALELDRPGVVGHSGGAYAAAIVAADHPDLVSYLALEDPPWGTGWGDWESMTAELAQWFLDMKKKSRGELESGCKADHPDWSDAIIDAWVESSVQVNPRVIQEYQQPEMDWQDIASRIQCPTLLVSSDLEREPLLTEENVTEIVRHFVNIRKVRIPGTGHMIHFDNPEKFSDVMRSFLRTMWWSRLRRLSS
jgi:N-formylmaleamate deformylase